MKTILTAMLLLTVILSSAQTYTGNYSKIEMLDDEGQKHFFSEYHGKFEIKVNEEKGLIIIIPESPSNGFYLSFKIKGKSITKGVVKYEGCIKTSNTSSYSAQNCSCYIWVGPAAIALLWNELTTYYLK